MGFSREEYWSGLPFPSPGSFTISLQILLLACCLPFSYASIIFKVKVFKHFYIVKSLVFHDPSSGFESKVLSHLEIRHVYSFIFSSRSLCRYFYLVFVFLFVFIFNSLKHLEFIWK